MNQSSYIGLGFLLLGVTQIVLFPIRCRRTPAEAPERKHLVKYGALGLAWVTVGIPWSICGGT